MISFELFTECCKKAEFQWNIACDESKCVKHRKAALKKSYQWHLAATIVPSEDEQGFFDAQKKYLNELCCKCEHCATAKNDVQQYFKKALDFWNVACDDTKCVNHRKYALKKSLEWHKVAVIDPSEDDLAHYAAQMKYLNDLVICLCRHCDPEITVDDPYDQVFKFVLTVC